MASHLLNLYRTTNRGKAELIGWGPRSAVFLPDAFSHMGRSAFGATAHADVHGAVHDAFMTLPPYTRTSEDEVHELGLGVRNCSHRALSDPLSEQSESIELACEATSAEGTARCASRGIYRPYVPVTAKQPLYCGRQLRAGGRDLFLHLDANRAKSNCWF
jgi:hypothetical protein